MQITLTPRETSTTLSLQGRFVFEVHHEFRGAIDNALLRPAKEIRIDFSGVEYVDSAAIGMLLVLNDKAKDQGKHVVLSNAHGKALEVLRVTNIHKVLTVA